MFRIIRQTLDCHGTKIILCTERHQVLDDGNGIICDLATLEPSRLQFTNTTRLLAELICPCSGQLSRDYDPCFGVVILDITHMICTCVL